MARSGTGSTTGEGAAEVVLTPSSLRGQAVRVVRGKIMSGALRPGNLYALGTLAEQLGVSVTPVREAILELAKEGVVEVVRNRGFRVRELTDHDLDEIVELRRMIEPAAVRLIADGRLATDTGELRELAAVTEKCAISGDWVGFIATDRDLHLRILAYLQNDRLLQAVASLRDQTRLYGLDRVAGTEALLSSTQEHDQLLDAIIAGDGDLAAAILDSHIRHVRGIWAGRSEEPPSA